jgi:hypothetical protein
MATKALGTPIKMATMASIAPTMTAGLQPEFVSTGVGATEEVGIAVDARRGVIEIEVENVELIAGILKVVVEGLRVECV